MERLEWLHIPGFSAQVASERGLSDYTTKFSLLGCDLAEQTWMEPFKEPRLGRTTAGLRERAAVRHLPDDAALDSSTHMLLFVSSTSEVRVNLENDEERRIERFSDDFLVLKT